MTQTLDRPYPETTFPGLRIPCHAIVAICLLGWGVAEDDADILISVFAVRGIR